MLSNIYSSGNLYNNNPTEGRSSKTNPCPVCSDTQQKCKFTETGVLCFNTSSLSIGEVINGYRLNAHIDGMGGALSHVSDRPHYSQKAKKKTKKVKKLTKCEAAKPDKAQHIADLRSLTAQLPPTKKAIDFLNDRFGIEEDAKYWHSLGYFSVSGKEVNLAKPVPATVAGMKANKPQEKSSTFSSAWGSAVNILIADVHGNVIGHQPKNFSKNAPKYTWNTYKDASSKSTINDSKVKQADGSFEPPMPVVQAGSDNRTIYVCEGTLKPLIAAHQHQKTFIGGASPLSAYPQQLKETLEVLKPNMVVITPDAGAIANKNVCSTRIEGNIESLLKVRRQLDLKFEIAIADWGQLWSKEGIGDIDEINSKIFNRQKLIPARDWMHSESQITGKNHAFMLTITNIYSSHKHRNDKSTRANSLRSLHSASLDPVNFERNPAILKGLIEAAEVSNVFRRFCLKEKLSPVECAAIASSLAWISGGEKTYKSLLHEDYKTPKGSNNNVQNFCSVIRKVGFNPCPMPDIDYSLYDIARCKNVLRLESPQTVTIEQSQVKLREAIKDALECVPNWVLAIEVSTGVGKTHNLSLREFYEYLKQNNQKVVILFATHKLLQEFRGAVQYPVLAQVELKLPPVLNWTINELYQFGKGKEANDLLFQCAAYNPVISDYYGTGELIKKELTVEIKQNIRDYLKAKSQIKEGSDERVILATHSFFSLCPDCFEGRTIIADEDISKSYLRVSSAPLDELSLVARGCQPEYYGEILARLDAANDNEVIDISDITVSLNADTLMNYFQSKRSGSRNSKGRYKSSIPNLLNAAQVVKNGKKFSILGHRLSLPETKIIILSATPNKAILKQLAGDRFKLVDAGDTELKGNLYQIADRSYSRSCIKELDVKELQELTGNLPVITTISNKNKFKNPSQTIHFGNCLGYNELKGADLIVVGFNQPSPADMIALFIASGGSIEGKDLRFKNQTVFYNGHRFPFYCFVDEELRNLQFELINADLEQAVGRARLTRMNVTVLTIAGFPLKQAQLINKQDWLNKLHELQTTQLNNLEAYTQEDRVIAEATLALDEAEDLVTQRSSSMDDRPGEGCQSQESEIQEPTTGLGEEEALRTTEENILDLAEYFNFEDLDSELLMDVFSTPGITQELIDAAWSRLSLDRQRYLTRLTRCTA